MNTRHAFEKFGYTEKDDSRIRIERLEKRHVPAVPFPHKHDFYHVLLIERGSGTHEIDFVQHRLKAKQLFLMKPGQVHSWTLSKETAGFVLEFTDQSLALPNEEKLAILAALQSTSDCVSLKDTSDYASLHQVLSLMFDEAHAKKWNYQQTVASLLATSLIKMLRLTAHTRTITPGRDFVSLFRDLVEGNFKDRHDVQFYADELSLTPRALTMKLKRLVDRSPSQIIQDRCVLEAKRLLSYSNLSIAEVGYAIGFEDPNYFSRFFKKASGDTPATFRSRSQR